MFSAKAHLSKSDLNSSRQVSVIVRREANEKSEVITGRNYSDGNQHGKTVQEIIRVKDVPAYIGVSKSTYHNYRDRNSKYFDASFPPIVAISRHCKGHFIRELNNWLEHKKIAVSE